MELTPAERVFFENTLNNSDQGIIIKTIDGPLSLRHKL